MVGGQIENLVRNELGRRPLSPRSEKKTPYVDNEQINDILNRYRAAADQDYLEILRKREGQRKELFEYLGQRVKTVAKGALYVGVAAAAIGAGYGMFVSHQAPGEVINEGMGLVKSAAAFVGEQLSKVGDKISNVLHGPKGEPGKALFDVGGQRYSVENTISGSLGLPGNEKFGVSEGGAIYNAAKDIYSSVGVDNPHEWAKNLTIDVAAPVVATLGPDGLATTTQHPNVKEWKWIVGALSAVTVGGIWNKLRPLQRLGNMWKTFFPDAAYNELGAHERDELNKALKEARIKGNEQLQRELETAMRYHKDKLNALRELETQKLGIPEPPAHQDEPQRDNPFHRLLEEDEARHAQGQAQRTQQAQAQAQEPPPQEQDQQQQAEPEPEPEPEPEQEQPTAVNMDVAPGMAAILQNMPLDQQNQLAQDIMMAMQQRMTQAQQQPPAQPVPPAPPRFPDYENLTRGVVDDLGDAGTIT